MPELKCINLETIEAMKLFSNAMIIERDQSKHDWAKTSNLWTSGRMVLEGRKNFIENLTVENIYGIRLHTTYVTGGGINGDITPFTGGYVNLYNIYINDIPERFHVSEPPMLNVKLKLPSQNGKYINADYVRYQACITNLFLQGAFDDEQHYIIMEVGSGTGGLAYSFEQIGLDFTYILIDTPEILQLATAYLLVNSKKRIYLYDKETFTDDFIKNELYSYNFVLLPNYILPKLDILDNIDFFINQASFQEMAELQVETYLNFAQKKVSKFIYSENVDRHSENLEINTSVTSMLSKRFILHPNENVYPPMVRADTFGKKFIGVQLNSKHNFKPFRY